MYYKLKDSARITLNDKFIGDEGCGKLSDFIANHRRIYCLEIKSNDIGSSGFKMIFKALAENPNLRYLILEYNNLGESYEGVEYLGTLLSVLNRLEYLNISNNKLEDQSLEILSTAISMSKSLKLLEIKFNNLTSKGMQYLIGDLKRNHNGSLLFVDIAGNKVDKQTHEQLEEVLKTNRKNNPTSREKIMTITVKYERFSNTMSNFGQVGAPMGAQMTGMPSNMPSSLGNTLADEIGRYNMLRHMENILEQNRRDTAEMKVRMERYLYYLLKRYKLDARELTDLENKCNEMVLFNRNLKFYLDRIMSDHQQQQRDHTIQMRNHDERLRYANRYLNDLQNKYQDVADRMSREHSARMKEITRYWEAKLRGLEERIRMAEVEHNDIENDIKKAMEKRERLKFEMAEEEQVITQRVEEEEAQRYSTKLASLESRLAEVQEARELYLKRNNDLVYELEKTYQKNGEEVASLYAQLADLQEKQDLFMKKNKYFIAVNERITSDIKLKEMQFEKLYGEINSLNYQIELKKKFNKDQIDKVLNEQAYEKTKASGDRETQMAKLAELERVLRASQIENTRLRQYYMSLAETVQLNVSKAIESVFANNNLF